MRVVGGISGRLLVLTILVVMLVEVAIFVPSVARFRLAYLEERLVRAEIAALTVMAAPDGMVPEELQGKLLRNAETLNVAVAQGGDRIVALAGQPVEPAATYDLRDAGAVELMRDALGCLFTEKRDAVLRILGDTGRGIFDHVEIVIPAAPLRAAMLDYGLRILQLSLIISVITAACVFLAVRRFVVAPLLRVIGSMKAFQENPEDAARVIAPLSRLGEVAEAEQALAAMQGDVLRSLRERARLAALGEAVAKISHDLRNMLAAGQLVADRLERSNDPLVRRVLPKLVASMDRAIGLCERTLDFGRAEERPPELRQVELRRLIEDVAEDVGLGMPGAPARLTLDMTSGETVLADPDHLYRVLANLMRNALEAVRSGGRSGEISVRLASSARESRITISDTGPGMPPRAVENLFRPFRGGARQGGTGLGLAIAAELVRAHGGTLALLSSTTAGTSFEICLPKAPAPVGQGTPFPRNAALHLPARPSK